MDDADCATTAGRAGCTLTTMLVRSKWGSVIASYGSSSFFTRSRTPQLGGMGFRWTYVAPPWMFRLILSLSVVAGFVPRFHIDLLLHVATVIPLSSPIFGCIGQYDIAGIKQLLRSGKADPRDQSPHGFTPLHVSALSPRNLKETLPFV